MTWETHAARRERIPVLVVEIDLDWIADVGVTATNPDGSLCYRTPATTSQGTFAVTTRTRRWMSTGQRAIATLDAIPCLKSASIAAEEIRIGRGLGFFGKATITLADFVDDDRRFEDPFAGHASRSGINPEAGSYFGKLFARNPYWTNRPIRVIEGWTTDGVWDPSDTIVHNYFVRDVQGPTGGTLTINAAGPLQLLNLDEAEAPAPSDGVLEFDITSSATTASIADPVLAATYPASGLLRIGDEVVSFTRSGQTLTIGRALKGTIADTHQAGDSLQLVLSYTAQPITNIIQDLLVTYGGINTANLALAEWATEGSTWLADYVLSGDVTQPTKLLDLVQELVEIAVAVMWWDDQTGQIRLRSVRPATTIDATWTDKANLLTRPVLKRDMAERVSRTDVLCDLRSAAGDPKVSSSYRIRLLGNEEGAAATEHGSTKLKLIASRWLNAASVNLGIRATAQITAQLRDGRQTYTVEVSAKDSAHTIGDVIDLQSADIIDRNGTIASVRCIVAKRETVKNGSVYRYTLERSGVGGRFAFFTADPMVDYSAASSSQRDPGAFFADAAGGGLGGDPYYAFS
jgi:hypothetical protein